MKKWKILHKAISDNKEQFEKELVATLLKNRGIKTKEEIEKFLHPRLTDVSVDSVGIDRLELQKCMQRLQKAYDSQEQIVVFGDYDVDGITGSAILWETLYHLGFNVIPYIPHRVDEGYGLSKAGIRNIQDLMTQRMAGKVASIQLIITVDNGIVARDAVDFANSLGIDVIITDHHLPEGETQRPNALAIVHTTQLCGAGVAYLLCQEIRKLQFGSLKKKKEHPENAKDGDVHLELAALGTIADLVPLTGSNRTIVKYGLEKLRQTRRLGLLALFTEAAIDSEKIGTYEVGFVIAPRLNAAGRIESAMDSLRLLCTHNEGKAFGLAGKLGSVNRERQEIMKKAAEQAITFLTTQRIEEKKILFVGDKNYNPGIIGLVAGKLVEKFYKPAVVLAIGETHAKASVRSVAGVNIIELLRTHHEMYVNIGGHPMAAGFTVEIGKMQELQEKIELLAEQQIPQDVLQRSVTIDCELPLRFITPGLYKTIQQLAPFGMGNTEPFFVSLDVVIKEIRILGRDGKHIKFKITQETGESKETKLFEAIGFNMAKQAEELHVGDRIAIAYAIDENAWNGNVTLQLKLKDFSTSFTGGS